MTPNRVTVLGSVLAALGAFLTALLGAFHSETAKGAVACTALLVAGAVVVVYLFGWQKHEARQLSPTRAQDPPPPSPLNVPPATPPGEPA